jgi:hypothetical protein
MIASNGATSLVRAICSSMIRFMSDVSIFLSHVASAEGTVGAEDYH